MQNANKEPLIQTYEEFQEGRQSTKPGVEPLECSALYKCTQLHTHEVSNRGIAGGEISSVETSLHIYLNENLDIVKHYNTTPS